MLLGRWLLCLAAVGLSACGIQPLRDSKIPPLDGLEPTRFAAAEPLALSPDMREFVAQHAPSDMHRRRKAWSIAYTTSDRNLFGFNYDPLTTLSGAEAFDQRRGNCLSFSSMVIALAREAGLKAWYQRVHIPPSWDSNDEMAVVSMHVNAIVSSGGGEYTLDVSRETLYDHYRTEKLSDRDALAHYYNNLAIDRLIENDLAGAHGWLALAIRANPGSAYAWSNLGVVFRRHGQNEDAEMAYRRALLHEPGHSSAASNLLLIYEEQERVAEANELRSRVERYRYRSPWHLAAMSREASQAGDYNEAVRLLRRAIRFESRDYRLYAALAESLVQAGDFEAARDSCEQALSLAPSNLELPQCAGRPLTSAVDSARW